MLNSLLRRLIADRYRGYLDWVEPVAEVKDLLGTDTPADIRQERRKHRNLSAGYVDLFQVRQLIQPGWESRDISATQIQGPKTGKFPNLLRHFCELVPKSVKPELRRAPSTNIVDLLTDVGAQ
jgi:hypothetical protein